jgi:dTDP-glucose 4,6-dehydratase
MKYAFRKISELLNERFGFLLFNGSKQARWQASISRSTVPRDIRNVLITGGAGFIGSHLVKHLKTRQGMYITVMDSLTYAGNLENLAMVDHDFVKMDIRDRRKLLEWFKDKRFDAIIHLAAESHVDRSIENPMEFVETNVMGTVNLLDAALDQYKWNPDFIFYHVSTDEVFGSLSLEGWKKFDEDTPYDPRSPYSASKASSDHFVRAYHHTYKLPVLISNCSNNYGSHQYPEKMIPVIINSLITRKPIPIYGEGLNRRDWLHVEDHADAIRNILLRGTIGETYCVGGNNDINNIELAMVLCEIFDEMYGMRESMKLITFVKDRKGHDMKYAVNISKMRWMLGWRPSKDFKEGLMETVKWYVNNHFKKNNEHI